MVGLLLLSLLGSTDAFLRVLPHGALPQSDAPQPPRVPPPPLLCPLRRPDSSSFTASLRELERVRAPTHTPGGAAHKCSILYKGNISVETHFRCIWFAQMSLFHLYGMEAWLSL